MIDRHLRMHSETLHWTLSGLLIITSFGPCTCLPKGVGVDQSEK